MNTWSAMILGAVQGLTEFIPVSSSGHLLLVPHLFDWPASGLAFDTMLHFGTLLALLVYFRRDVFCLTTAWAASLRSVRSFKSWRQAATATQEARLAWLVLLGSVPAAVVGLSFKGVVERLFAGSSYSTAFFLLVTGTMIWVFSRPGRRRRSSGAVSIRTALLVGLAQALAIMPGISRSGATISAGMMLGLDEETAPRFSFLLAIPAIAGATLIQLKDLRLMVLTNPQSLLAGLIISAVSGYVAIVIVYQALRRERFHLFAYYCWLAGLFMLGWFYWR